MLKQRVLTASLLAPLIIWGILSLNTDVIAIVLAVFIILAAWEWARLIGLQTSVLRAGYSAGMAVLLFLANYTRLHFPDIALVLLLVGVLWWLFGTAWVLMYKGQTGLSAVDTTIGLFVGVMVLIPCWLGMMHIHAYADNGPSMLLFVMMLIWAADIGAYFAGHKFGKHKLAPLLSPGKTIEGVIGGVLAALVLSLLGAQWFGLPELGVTGFVALSVVVVMFSVVGDLFESLFKRRAGVKDSGRLLPGHGGMLDRIDSLTAATPVFALGLAVLA